MDTKEEWRDVVGYEGHYKVGSFGNVLSLKHSFGKKLAFGYNIQGRRQVMLCLNGKTKRHLVNRLVAEAFIGPCPKGMVCCHNDGNCLNNKPENLRWDTQKNNAGDAIKHGTIRRGENHGRTPLTEKDVIEIRESKEQRIVLAKKYGVSQPAISCIVLRKTWRHV